MGEDVDVEAPDPDAGLVAAAVRGDPAASRTLFTRHAPMVLRIARRIAGDGPVAEDLVQDVFMRVFERLSTFRGEARFTTWLHRVAVRTCLNGVRRPQRVRRMEIPLGEPPPHRRGDDDAALLRVTLSDAIDALPLALRMPLVLFALEGLTHREVAQALSISEGASRRRVSEARARLRQALSAGPEREASDGA